MPVHRGDHVKQSGHMMLDLVFVFYSGAPLIQYYMILKLKNSKYML